MSRDIYAAQDDCLIFIEGGKPVPTAKLQALPPWRAVLVARVSEKAGVPLESGTVEQLVAEAARVGGNGTLGCWWANGGDREQQLDTIQEIIEAELDAIIRDDRYAAPWVCVKDQVSARIVNELERAGWLNLGAHE